MEDQPLSYWMAVARMGFEEDFNRLFDELGLSRTELAERIGTTPAYISKILNGGAGNFQLETMTKLARAIDAILQVRLIKGDGEVVRVVDYETARALDNSQMTSSPPDSQEAKHSSDTLLRPISYIDDYRRSSGNDRLKKQAVSQEISTELILEEDYG